MNPSGNRPEKKGVPPEVGKRAASLGAEVGFSTLAIILGALFGGLWLDNYFDTRPLLTLALVLGTVPVALVITYMRARQAIRDYEESHKPVDRNSLLDEGDESGE